MAENNKEKRLIIYEEPGQEQATQRGGGREGQELALCRSLLLEEGTSPQEIMQFALELAALRAKQERDASQEETRRLALELKAQTAQAKIQAEVRKAEIGGQVAMAKVRPAAATPSTITPPPPRAAEVPGQRPAVVQAPMMTRRSWLKAAGIVGGAGLLAATTSGIFKVLGWQEDLQKEREALFAEIERRQQQSLTLGRFIVKSITSANGLPSLNAGITLDARREGDFTLHAAFQDGDTTYMAQMPVPGHIAESLEGEPMRLTRIVLDRDKRTVISRRVVEVSIRSAGIVAPDLTRDPDMVLDFHKADVLAGELLDKFSKKLPQAWRTEA